ncbi:MAG TPA: YadA-like family protein, partial [Pseudoxanthomonas sp.]|nr:YadA-like family protein [Pseudoxanthomonas sp.]
ALGGGAGFSGGVFIAPSYSIQGNSYSNVGAAFTAVDAKLTELFGKFESTNAGAAAAPPAQSGQARVAASSNASQSMQDSDAGPATASASAEPVSSGQQAVAAASDDVPVAAAGYADAGDAATLSSAQSYADNAATQTLTSANAYTDFKVLALEDDFNAFRSDVDRRFSQQDQRLDKMGAMSSAMLNMAINAAGSRSPRGRIAVGAGWQNGENALSVGYAKPIGERASFSIGGAFSGDEKSAGVGFGIDL